MDEAGEKLKDAETVVDEKASDAADFVKQTASDAAAKIAETFGMHFSINSLFSGNKCWEWNSNLLLNVSN